ncbi:NAD-dependent epimerase/dehydratase family protein [Bacillota bacterium Meth-B3]
MKHVLIAGAGSYIGAQFERHLAGFPGAYRVSTLDVKGDAWREADFSGVDAVVLVAGIAHQKETAANAPLYYSVNRDLAVDVARKAQAEGVKQLVFLSTIAVYGLTRGAIGPDAKPQPRSHYGKSKLAAEALLTSLAGDGFRVAVLRPPMVYGPHCRGNYPRLAALAQRLPLFPACGNRRSALYVGHLAEAIRLIVDSGEGGLFLPQDGEYVDTGEMMRLVARAHGRGLKLIPGLRALTRLLGRLPGAFGKVFGDLTIDRALSERPEGYRRLTLKQAIEETERGAIP